VSAGGFLVIKIKPSGPYPLLRPLESTFPFQLNRNTRTCERLIFLAGV
jgi:hypothetical protein